MDRDGRRLPGADRAAVYCGPETRTRQTAQSLGLSATPDDALRDLDCGHWAGLPMTATDPADLTAWLTDPTYRAHGGESLTDLLARTHTWLTTLENRGDPIIAITHPAVARAAILTTLDAPAKSFWRIDIPPLTTITLHHRPPAWTLRTTPHPVIRRPCSTAPDAGG
ncbi:histidine phosphatase family protein [Nocardia transvalensis]|uniref:histidine phosphatase family protein n=1 Tax=Nocardia transvalensis TaxID=37333 RepID=UPI003570E818